MSSPSSSPSSRSSSRSSARRGGWRVALRLARREALRRKAQTALMLVLICLPVLAVTAAAVVWRTADVSGAEGVDRRMGSAAAYVEASGTDRVAQHFDPETATAWLGEPTETWTGVEQIRAVAGEDREILPLRRSTLGFETPKGIGDMEAVEVDLTDPLTDGLFRLSHGRWPQERGEVVVNPALTERGPGLGDTLTVVRNGPDGERTTDVRIVGIAESTATRSLPVAAGPLDGFGPGADPVRTWLLGGGPVTWDDVRALNEIGVLAASRAVLTDPPPSSALPPEVLLDEGIDQATLTVLVLVVVMVLIEVVLLAGPAFAVRAKAQARSLALVAATGGTPAQARRTVLASGVVVGVVGGILGVVLGIGVGAIAAPVTAYVQGRWFGPFEVPWAMLALVAAFGFLSAFLAAVVPAFSASRHDVVAVLAGRRGEGRPSARSPLVGLVLIGLGIAGALLGVAGDDVSPLLVGGSAIVSVLGMVLLVPVTVATVARLSARLPLPLRFAARDAARHRTRTVPAVAAVGATVAGVVALSIAIGSQATADEQRYSAQLPLGQASLALTAGASDSDLDAVRGTITGRLPGAAITPVEGVRTDDSDGWVELELAADGEHVGYDYYGNLGSAYLVGTEIPPYVDLDPAERERAAQVLADGGVALLRGSDKADLGLDELSIAVQRYDQDGQQTTVADEALPAAAVRASELQPVVALVLSQQAAERLDLTVATVGLVIGPTVDEDAEKDLAEALAALPAGGYLYVERGFQLGSDRQVVQLVLTVLGGVLMLGGTLTATFLALSDARPDLATMAAVGARPRTRRTVAASYALVVGSVGAVLGAIVGFIPGVAISKPLTEDWETGATVLDIPWLIVIGVVVGLPLLTAAAVGASARSRLPLAARID